MKSRMMIPDCVEVVEEIAFSEIATEVIIIPENCASVAFGCGKLVYIVTVINGYPYS